MKRTLTEDELAAMAPGTFTLEALAKVKVRDSSWAPDSEVERCRRCTAEQKIDCRRCDRG